MSYEKINATITVVLDKELQESVNSILEFYKGVKDEDGDHPFESYTKEDAVRLAMEFGAYNKIREYADMITQLKEQVTLQRKSLDWPNAEPLPKDFDKNKLKYVGDMIRGKEMFRLYKSAGKYYYG